MAKNFTRCLPALLLALAVPMVAQAAHSSAAVNKQVSTAAAHAGMAMGAADLKMVRTHLHHVVNCLQGPSGSAFDAKAGTPCKGQGNGAITDAKGDAATETKLHTALTQAEAGLKAKTVDAAHADAKKAMDTLQG
jgi:hypothetical protein